MAESFETQEYSEENEAQSKFGTIYQIVEQMTRESPVAGVRVVLAGNMLKFIYNCYEMHLHDVNRLRLIEDQAKQVLNSTISELKKQFRKLRKETLNLKEKKELANNAVQKVSQNQRYLYTSWRFYELGE